MSKTTVPSTVLRFLSKVFEAEVENRLPYQCRDSAALRRAIADDLVASLETQLGEDRFRVSVSGWQLTHRGRMIYCESCAEVEK